GRAVRGPSGQQPGRDRQPPASPSRQPVLGVPLARHDAVLPVVASLVAQHQQAPQRQKRPLTVASRLGLAAAPGRRAGSGPGLPPRRLADGRRQPRRPLSASRFGTAPGAALRPSGNPPRTAFAPPLRHRSAGGLRAPSERPPRSPFPDPPLAAPCPLPGAR